MARRLGDGDRRPRCRHRSPLPGQSTRRVAGFGVCAARSPRATWVGVMWKFLLPFAAFVALVVLFAFGLNPKRDIHALPSPLIGKPAPEFALSNVIDPLGVVSNAALKGQVYVVNVWGTWCAECRVEHDALLAISQQHVVPIIRIDCSVDHGLDERDKAKQWLERLGNPSSQVAIDQKGVKA